MQNENFASHSPLSNSPHLAGTVLNSINLSSRVAVDSTGVQICIKNSQKKGEKIMNNYSLGVVADRIRASDTCSGGQVIESGFESRS